MTKPVKRQDIVRERIIDISHQGQGVIKVDGYTVFVEDGLIDDLVDVEITNARKNFGFGKVVEVVEESEHRIESKCEVSHECGGCQFQELDYKKQLEYKEDMVKNNLMRIGNIENPPMENIIGMDEPYRYRNNVQIPVGMSRGYPLIGYYKKGSNYIVDTDTCKIQDEIADRAIKVLREFMMEYGVQGYNHKHRRGMIRHMVVRTAEKTKDTMIVIVTNSHKLPNKNIMVDMFTEAIPEIKSIVNNVNTEDTNMVLGDSQEVLFGEGHIKDTIGELTFRISPQSFFQINSVQTEKLYGKVKDYLDLDGSETLVDLYCGIGTIGMYLADSCSQVIGIETMKESIKDGEKNLKLNSIDNMEFLEGNAENVFPKLVEDGVEVDALVVDPPRKGLDEEVVEAILELQPEKFVYVSCESATLARDLERLEEVYRVGKVQPVDMFPHTTHVESVVLLEKISK